jgi:hypothetical protein
MYHLLPAPLQFCGWPFNFVTDYFKVKTNPTRRYQYHRKPTVKICKFQKILDSLPTSGPVMPLIVQTLNRVA